MLLNHTVDPQDAKVVPVQTKKGNVVHHESEKDFTRVQQMPQDMRKRYAFWWHRVVQARRINSTGQTRWASWSQGAPQDTKSRNRKLSVPKTPNEVHASAEAKR